MRHLRMSTTALAAIVIGLAGLFSSSQSAEAGWGLFRRHFHRHHVHYRSSWPNYGWCGYNRYHVARPVHYYRYYTPTYYYAPRYYVPYPTYYATPYVDYGCYGWGGYGGFYSANTVSPLSNIAVTSRVEPQQSLMGLARNESDVLASGSSNRLDLVKLLNRSEPAPAQVAVTDAERPLFDVAATTSRFADGKIELKVNVPAEARVTINDYVTRATGTERVFFARAAKSGDEYEFVVKAELEVDGLVESKTKRIVLRGGQASSLAFDLRPSTVPQETTPLELKPDRLNLADEATMLAKADTPVHTSLKLRVPENAKVYMAGVEMKQTGNVRVFQTNHLQPGQELADYHVKVVLEGDGPTESREKQVTLVGGQSQEVAFEFSPATRLAAR